MERVSFTVHPDLDLAELLSLLLDGGTHAAAVVDAGGELLGVVSKADVLTELCGAPLDGEARMASSFGGVWEAASSLGLRARDVMTPRAVVVAEETSLAGGAALIARGIHPVPVVDDDGRLTGTLSSIDVLRWLARNHRNPEL
jgi:CBS-domain-containing membrane protein